MQPNEQEIVTREMIRGFNDCCIEAKTIVTGGQSVKNEWPIIGGVANVMCQENEYILPNYGKPGDILVLTKPLGTQVASNLHQWYMQKNERWDKVLKLMSQEEAINGYELAVESMAHLNKNTATLMKKYNSHGGTDVTGFGLMGHSLNLARVQKEDVELVIHSLPIIDKMEVINNNIANFKLTKGYSAETSGGILCMVDKSKVNDFVKEHKETYGQDVWIIGEVVKGSKNAVIRDDSSIIHVKDSFLQ